MLKQTRELRCLTAELKKYFSSWLVVKRHTQELYNFAIGENVGSVVRTDPRTLLLKVILQHGQMTGLNRICRSATPDLG